MKNVVGFIGRHRDATAIVLQLRRVLGAHVHR